MWVHTFITIVQLIKVAVPRHFGVSLLPSILCLQTAALVGREKDIHDAHTVVVLYAFRETHITNALCVIINILITSNIASENVIIMHF